MLFDHADKGLICPWTTRFGSWHDRHICPLELSRTRKFCAIWSMFWVWGLWQLVHSTLPLISFTLCSGSAVVPCDTRDAARSAVSLMGVTRLKGCELVRSVPKASPGAQLPVVVTLP